MDPVAQRYREALLDTLGAVPRQTPILLSGGMDSMTLLFGSLALEREPVAYSYALENWNYSEDWEAAHAVCVEYGLTHLTVRLPTDDAELVELTRRVIRIGKTTRKTAVQCLYAIVPLIETIYEHGHRGVITGTGGIVSDNRRAKILGADYEKNREELEAQRRSDLLGGDPESATEVMKRVIQELRVIPWEPYSMEPLAEVGLSIPYPEMNDPVAKGVGCRAFPEFFGEPPYRWWRQNSSLQVNGGIRDLHERLLSLPVNKRGSQRVVGVYNDIEAELAGGEQLSLT